MYVLGANRIPPDVHDIANSDVAQNIQHPNYVVQSRYVSIISIIVEDSGSWGDPLVLQQVVVPRNIAAAHFRETIGQVCLLPLPEETVDVGVMQIEKGVSRAGALELELLIWSAVRSCGEIFRGMVGSLPFRTQPGEQSCEASPSNSSTRRHTSSPRSTCRHKCYLPIPSRTL